MEELMVGKRIVIVCTLRWHGLSLTVLFTASPPFKFENSNSDKQWFSHESGVRVEIKPCVSSEIKQQESEVKERKDLSIEYFVGIAFYQLSHFPKFDGLFHNMCVKISSTKLHLLLLLIRDEGISHAVNHEDKRGTETSLQNLANGFLCIPSSNVERLRSTLSNVSLTVVIEFLPQMGRTVKEDHPDKKKLFSAQDFFRYTAAEEVVLNLKIECSILEDLVESGPVGIIRRDILCHVMLFRITEKRYFQELDRDGDGQVTLEDLEVAMRKRKLPKRYTIEFMRRARTSS